MKRVLIGLWGCLFWFQAFAQSLPVRYVNASGDIVEMPTNSITSDFGRRHSTWNSGWDPSPWHMGTDYTPADCNHRSIVTIASGQVARIIGTNGYKILVVEGGTYIDTNFVDNDNDFGYGHIFFNGEVGSDGLKSGDFVFLRMDAPKSQYYAILNLLSDTAIGETKGTVTYKKTQYPVTRRVNVNQLIAPIGGSGGGPNGYTPHFHLYRPANPTENPQDKDNAKNPFAIVQHDEPRYKINIEELDRLTPATDLTTFYACSQLNSDNNSSVKVKVALREDGYASGGGWHFDNSAYNIESVKLFIKNYLEPASLYRHIVGQNVQSKIIMGGKPNQRRYPNQGILDLAFKPNTNTPFNGSFDKTGIEPHAYHNGNYDFFYFSDIFTRLHYSNNQALAPINKYARYGDGRYDLLVKAVTISGDTFPTTSNDSTHRFIVIDNFKPYVEKVQVLSGTLHYSSEWQANSQTQQLVHVVGGTQTPLDFCSGGTIVVTFSEQMLSASLVLQGSHLQLLQANNLNKTYTFILPSGNFGNNSQMVIDGYDMAGNAVHGLPGGFAQQQPIPFSQIPVRTSTGWSVLKNTTQGETSYWLFVEPQPEECEGISEQTPVANFNYSFIQGTTNQIQFINSSQNAMCAFWDFGNGIASEEYNPTQVTYEQMDYLQSFQVQLIVSNSEGKSHSLIKSISIPPLLSGGSNATCIDASQSHHIWQLENSYQFNIIANGGHSYDFIIDFGDGVTEELNSSNGFEILYHSYTPSHISQSHCPTVYCLGYDIYGNPIGESFSSLTPIVVEPLQPVTPVVDIRIISPYENAMATEPFSMKATLNNTQALFNWEWKIFNTNTPNYNQPNCLESNGCLTFKQFNSTSITTDDIVLPSIGKYKSRLWVWNGTFGGWFDYTIDVQAGGPCIVPQMLRPYNTYKLGSTICLHDNSCTFPGYGQSSPSECTWQYQNNGVYMPIYSGVRTIEWWLNGQQIHHLERCLPGGPFYQAQNITKPLCQQYPVPFNNYGITGTFTHKYDTDGTHKIALKAKAAQTDADGYFYTNEPSANAIAATETSINIINTNTVAFCFNETEVYATSNSNALGEDNILSAGLIELNATKGDFTFNPSNAFTVEAYQEITINCSSSYEFSTQVGTDILFTYREEPPYLDCKWEPYPYYPLKQTHSSDTTLDKITVYPNPTNNVINIQIDNHFDKPSYIEIVNTIGERIYYNNQIENISNKEINLIHLPTGVYYIRVVFFSKKVFSEKIVKL